LIGTLIATRWCLAREVHDQGYKVALTGEGSDEAMVGYVWFKTNKLLRWFDVAGFRASAPLSRFLRKLSTPHVPMTELKRIDQLMGGPHAQAEMYHFVSGARRHLYSDDLKHRIGTHLP